MRMLSLVAMSLNGMPTTSLAPSLRYSASGAASSDSNTAEKTVPSLRHVVQRGAVVRWRGSACSWSRVCGAVGRGLESGRQAAE